MTINGRIDFSKFEGLHPLYTEYNIGNYSRRSKIEQGGIKAELKDGVMTLLLPKSANAKPRKIKVN